MLSHYIGSNLEITNRMLVGKTPNMWTFNSTFLIAHGTENFQEKGKLFELHEMKIKFINCYEMQQKQCLHRNLCHRTYIVEKRKVCNQ